MHAVPNCLENCNPEHNNTSWVEGAGLALKYVDLAYPVDLRNVSGLLRGHTCQPITVIESRLLAARNRTTVSKISIDSFFRDAVLLDMLHKKPSTLIDDEDLEAAEESAGIATREGDVVVLRTGWEAYSSKPERYRGGFPTLSKNAVDYLLFRRIAGVAVDCPNVDSDLRLATHKMLFRAGVLVIENLRNLDEIDRSRFRMIALPLNSNYGREPARVVGIMDDSAAA